MVRLSRSISLGQLQLGYTVDELEGQSVLKVFYPEDQPSVHEQLNKCLQYPGQIFYWQLRKVRKDTSVLWVEEYARAVSGPEGSPIVLIVCQDITERKRAENEVFRKSEELCAANEEITATDEELRQNYDSLNKSQQALEQARRKLNILNSITFSDIQNAIFALAGYIELEKIVTPDEKLRQLPWANRS